MTNVPIGCPECGGKQFSFPDHQLQPEDLVTCAGCGRAFELQVIREHGQKQITDALAKTFGKSFKPRP